MWGTCGRASRPHNSKGGFMKPRNYFTKALDTLAEFDDTSLAEDFNCLRNHLQANAQCWHLDPHVLELVWNTDFDSSLFEAMRLPMPIMAVEYDFEHSLLHLGPPTEGRKECPPRCTILADSKALGEAFMKLYGSDRGGMDKWIEGILVYQFFNGQESWQLVPYMTVIPYRDLTGFAGVFSGKRYEMPLRVQGMVPKMTLKSMAERLGMDEAALTTDLVHMNPMIDDIKVCLGLLQLMQCHNVPVTTFPAPAKLNRKRMLRGRPPLPSYRTIRLSGVPQGHGGGGSKASPRAHMRRGFVRRQYYPSQQAHKNRWIAPTLVGGGEPVLCDVEVRP